MKRIRTISRFARPMSAADIRAIGERSAEFNRKVGVTGALVCVGDLFFQVLEGPESAVDALMDGPIARDGRHKDLVRLKDEPDIAARWFPDSPMRVVDLNAIDDSKPVPTAFRCMMEALVESHDVLAAYTPPQVLRSLASGANPLDLPPRRREVTVLFADLVDFTGIAERLTPESAVAAVERFVTICDAAIQDAGGIVTKLLGDGVVAYSSAATSDAAVQAAASIVAELSRAPSVEGERLRAGIGITRGVVIEGNVGSKTTKDFTIIGDTVNLAARVQGLTRVVGTGVLLTKNVRDALSKPWPLVSVGPWVVRGRNQPVSLFGLVTTTPKD